MHPVLALDRRRRARGSTPNPAMPSGLSWRLGQGRIEAAFETPTPSACAVADRADARRRGRRAHPVHRDLRLRRPDHASAVFTSYETGRRYRVTVLPAGGRSRATAPRGRSARGRRSAATAGRWSSRSSRRPGPRTRDRVVRRGRRREPTSSPPTSSGSPRGAGRRRGGASPRTCCGRRPCAARVPAARVDPDVEALDGQGVELGPLLQRAGPRPGLPAGARPVPRVVRPAGRVRRAARLGHPFRDARQLREAADPRVGVRQLRARSRCASTAQLGRSTSGSAAGRGSGSTSRRVPGHACRTTSTATTAGGTTRRCSTATGWSRRPTSPRSSSSSSTCSPTSPRSSGVGHAGRGASELDLRDALL